MAIDMGILRSIADTHLPSANDRDFFMRIWQTPLDVYINRIKNLDFCGFHRILDAGCGYGQWSIALSQCNHHVDGIDFDEDRIQTAQHIAKYSKVDNISFATGSIEATSYPDQYFDAIFSYSAIYFTDYLKTLTEFHRILKPGGRLYFVTNDLGWYIYNIIDGHNQSETFSSRTYAIETLRATLDYLQDGTHEVGQSLVMLKAYSLSKLEQLRFVIDAVGPDGSTRIIEASSNQSFYEAEKYDLTNVYEVLCTKS